MRVIAIDGSPDGSGRTQTALEVVLAGAAEAGAEIELLSLARDDSPHGLMRAVSAMGDHDAFILGTPVHRGTYSALTKAFLDRLPRGMWGETEAPITAHAVAMVMTGATWHHYLALGGLRDVLAGFFGAHVLTPGLYVPADGYDEDRRLRGAFLDGARAQGAAVVALAAAIADSPALRDVRPQA